MLGPLSLLVYGVVKLLAYSAWCWLALRIAGRSELLGRAAGMGAVRWVLGFVLGGFIFLLVQAPREHLLLTYLAIYVPVRFLEWLLLALIVLPSGARWPPISRGPWLAGGIVLSFLTDLVSPDMLEHGHFCVGRCLC